MQELFKLRVTQYEKGPLFYGLLCGSITRANGMWEILIKMKSSSHKEETAFVR